MEVEDEQDRKVVAAKRKNLLVKRRQSTDSQDSLQRPKRQSCRRFKKRSGM